MTSLTFVMAREAAGMSSYHPAPTAATMAEPSAGPSVTSVRMSGTLETSACICSHSLFFVAPPETMISSTGTPWARIASKMASVPKQMPSRMARNMWASV